MANNKIIVKRTTTSGRQPNTTGSYVTNSQYIGAGELALNMADGILYSSNGSSVIEIGANNTNSIITGSLTLKNDVQLRFNTVNTSAYAYFVQQSDDNFVFYTTNASYGARPVFNIYANSGTSAFSFGTPVSFTGANVSFGTGTALYANGSKGTAGQVLSSNGTTIYWTSPGAASVDQSAQYSWTNTHTFSANVSFTGNGIGINSNTGAIYLGGLADANWKIARNSGVVTKWKYTNNTIDIVTANSNLEGMSIGLVSGNSYFETGYLGTFIASNLTIGSATSNSTINSTTFSGTSNNSTYLNGNSASDLRSYSDTQAATAYSNATTFASNASNITSGTLGEPRLPYRMNQNVRTSDTVEFAGMTLTGNLVVSGNVNIIGANNLSLVDNMIYLNSNSTTANPDLGIAGNYNDGTYRHTGFFRDATDGRWKVFDSYEPEPDASVFIDTSNTSFHLADFQANTLYLGNTSTNWFTANATVVNATSYYVGATLIANSTGPYGKAENTLNVNAASGSLTNTFTIGTAAYYVTNGNFGIANSTPTNKLSVNGTTFLQANLTLGNSSVTAAFIANGSAGSSGQMLTSNGTATYWSTPTAGLTRAQVTGITLVFGG